MAEIFKGIRRRGPISVFYVSRKNLFFSGRHKDVLWDSDTGRGQNITYQAGSICHVTGAAHHHAQTEGSKHGKVITHSFPQR